VSDAWGRERTAQRDRWVKPAVMVLSAIVSIVIVASLGALVVAAACHR
jgi:hypothetical protein